MPRLLGFVNIPVADLDLVSDRHPDASIGHYRHQTRIFVVHADGHERASI